MIWLSLALLNYSASYWLWTLRLWNYCNLNWKRQ